MAISGAVLGDFQISAYRSCKHTGLLDLKNLTAIIGPNGSGKTNLLNALRLLDDAPLRARLADGDSFTQRCRIDATFRLGGKKIFYTKTLVLSPDEQNRDRVIRRKELWNFREINGENRWRRVMASDSTSLNYEIWTASREKTLVPNIDYIITSKGAWVFDSYRTGPLDEVPEAKRVARAYRAVRDLRGGIKYYSASQFTNPALCPTSFEIELEDESESVRSTSRTNSQTRFLIDLYNLWRAKNPRYEQFMNLISKDGVRLVDRIKWQVLKISSAAYEVKSGARVVNKRRERLMIVPTVFIGKSQLSFNQLSEGTFRTLGLLFYITTDNSRIMLIEEPEVCVHHGLLDSLIEVIKETSKRKQIIFSTHSDSVLDRLAPEQVRIASRSDKGGTVISSIADTMSAQEYQALKSFLHSTGNLGEYWKTSSF